MANLLGARWTGDELLAALPPDEQGEEIKLPPWFVEMIIAQYELGDLAKSLMYRWRYGKAPGYVGEAQVALADLLTMLRVVAAHNGLDVWVALRDGETRFMERMEKISAKLEKEGNDAGPGT